MLNWLKKASEWIGPGLLVYSSVSIIFIILALYAAILIREQVGLLKDIKQEIEKLNNK
jgi:hypothetical protein